MDGLDLNGLLTKVDCNLNSVSISKYLIHKIMFYLKLSENAKVA